MDDLHFRDSFRSGRPLRGFQLTSLAPHWPRHLQDSIDFAFIDCEHHCFSRGPFDLTATLGCLGDHQDERFQRAAKKIATAARSRGCGAGIYFAESPAKEAWADSLGYNLVIQGCDWTLIREAIGLRNANASTTN